jgi:hypothetical protein
MSRRLAHRDQVALRHLDKLAVQLRGLGLRADVLSDTHCFPGLTVTAAAGSASAVILAGNAHFWRHAGAGDMTLLGPLSIGKAGHQKKKGQG